MQIGKMLAPKLVRIDTIILKEGNLSLSFCYDGQACYEQV